MPTRSGRGPAKRANPPGPRPRKSRNAKGDIGTLPEWDLSDLYSGLHSPEFASDLARSDVWCPAFEGRYKGKLAALVSEPEGGKALAAAIQEFEAIDDL